MTTTVLFEPAPYVSPIELPTLPLGVSWTSLGQPSGTRPGPQQNNAALASICEVATQMVDDELNSEARAAVVTEMLNGPGSRLGILPSGYGRFMTSYRPVREVVAGSVAPAAMFPKTWNAMNAGSAYPEETPGQDDCSSILISPQYVSWWLGRYGISVQMTMVTGWAHSQLTTSSAAADTEVHVDHLTGMTGARVWFLDGPNAETANVETVTMDTPSDYSATVTYRAGQVVLGTDSNIYGCLIANGPAAPSQVQAITIGGSNPYWALNPTPTGPGTLTLASPLHYDHEPTVLVTSLRSTIRWAAALYAKSQALQRGLASVALQGDGKDAGPEEAIEAAERIAVAILGPFRRIL